MAQLAALGHSDEDKYEGLLAQMESRNDLSEGEILKLEQALDAVDLEEARLKNGAAAEDDPAPKRPGWREMKRKNHESRPVSDEGFTPSMRALIKSNPTTPTQLINLDLQGLPVGARIELYNLVGSEKAWNGQCGTVMGRECCVHKENNNVRVWVLEIAPDNPWVTKTAFFSDKCKATTRVPGDKKPKCKKTKPNEKCPCGSAKKYKKCCQNKEIE